MANNVYYQMKREGFADEDISLNIHLNFYGKLGSRDHTRRVLRGFDLAGIRYSKKSFDNLRSLYTARGNADRVALVNEFADAAQLM